MTAARPPITLYVTLVLAVVMGLFVIGQLVAAAYNESPTELAPVELHPVVDHRGVAMLCSDAGACILADASPYAVAVSPRPVPMDNGR